MRERVKDEMLDFLPYIDFNCISLTGIVFHKRINKNHWNLELETVETVYRYKYIGTTFVFFLEYETKTC